MRARLVGTLLTATLALGGCAAPSVGAQHSPSEPAPASASITASQAPVQDCVMLADQAADVLIEAVDATARRSSEAAEVSDSPSLFSEAGQSMPEVLRRFGDHSGRLELERAAQEIAERFTDAGCAEDDEAFTLLEDRLTTAVRQWMDSVTVEQETPEPETPLETPQLETPGTGQSGATPPVGGDVDGVAPDYLAATLLAIMRTTVRPVELFAVPDGFPPQFPVYPDAELVRSRASAGGVEAEWRVPGGTAGFESVESFYSDRLQTYRPGGWTSRGGPDSVTLGPDSEVVGGRSQFNVEGYGHDGTVVVEVRDDSDDVRITAVLTEG